MTTALSPTVVGAGLYLVLCLAACGSGTLSDPPGPPGTVLTPAVETATLASSGGGFHGLPPAGAACDPAQWTYLITLATQHVAWTGCTVSGSESDPGSYAVTTKDRMVVSEWPAVRAALENVTVSHATTCGADRDVWTLSVQTATATTTYGDDFYVCEKHYPQYVVSESLDNLYSELYQLP